MKFNRSMLSFGDPDEQGNYPKDSVNGRVQAKLQGFADNMRKFGKGMAIILEQSATADLTIMGRFGRTVFKSTMGSTVRNLILHGRGLTMLIDECFRLIPPPFCRHLSIRKSV